MLAPVRPYNEEIAGQEDGRSKTFRCHNHNTGSCAACRRRFSPGLHPPRQWRATGWLGRARDRREIDPTRRLGSSDRHDRAWDREPAYPSQRQGAADRHHRARHRQQTDNTGQTRSPNRHGRGRYRRPAYIAKFHRPQNWNRRAPLVMSSFAGGQLSPPPARSARPRSAGSRRRAGSGAQRARPNCRRPREQLPGAFRPLPSGSDRCIR